MARLALSLMTPKKNESLMQSDILLVHPRISTARSGTADFVGAAARKLFQRGLKVGVYACATSRGTVGAEISLTAFGPEVGFKSFHRLMKDCRANRGTIVSLQWTCAEKGNAGFGLGMISMVLLLRLMGFKTHVYLHQLWEPWGGPMNWPWSLWTRLQTLALVLISRRISAPVHKWTRVLKRFFFFKAGSINWVPVGATILPKTRALGTTERHGHPWVLLFNPLGTTKNPQLVEAAWARFAQKAPQSQCAVIGKVPQREDKRLAYMMQHPDCRFLGVIRSNEVSEWMSRSVALLAPFDEGVSGCRTSVISALAHGLPVVTTRGSATEPIWERTEGVILVDRNPSDLADALMRLHLDEAYWERASKQARIFYKTFFEWDKIIEQAYPEFGVAPTGQDTKQRFPIHQKNR